MLVNFTKMHGLGNDVVVIDAISQSVRLQSIHIKKIANRNFGIGCDQVLIVEPPIRPEADFYYRIYNSNGHEVEQCGNGARCIAQFVLDTGLINKTKLVADCIAGQIVMYINKDNLINVDFGKINATVQKHTIDIDKPNLSNDLFATSIGNPHGIFIVPKITDISITELGKELSSLSLFTNEANITFMQVINPKTVHLRTFERGAGTTLACGSGACAAVIVGQHIGVLQNPVTTKFAHGELTISFDKHTHNLQMSGPAVSVFIGKFRI